MTVLEFGPSVVMVFLAVTVVWWLARSRRSLEKEIARRRQTDRRLAMQYFLGEGLAQADSIPTGVSFALQLISQHFGWSFAAYWEADAFFDRLHCGATWTEREAGLEQFEAQVRSTAYAKGMGLPGKVWADGEFAAIDDASVDTDFPSPSTAAATAVRGAIAFPVVVSDRCIGVMQFLSSVPVSLTAGDRQMLSASGAQIGGFIERTRAVASLGVNEERFRSFITHSPTPAFLKDEEGRYRHVNEPFCKLFLRPVETCLGKTVFDLWPPETAKILHAHDRKVLTGTDVVQFEEQLRASDGEMRHWLVFRFPFRDHSGETLLAGIGVDITERKRDEQRRDEFFNASRDMLCLTGTDGYYKRVNPAFENTLGFPTDELLAKPLIEFVHSEDREATAAALRQLSVHQGTIDFENRYRCRNGSYRWIHWRATSLTGDMVSAIARDITERKTRETTLKRSQVRFENLVSALDGIVWEADPVTMKFTYVSPQAKDILGYPVERWLAEPTFWKNHLHPADRDRACAARTQLKIEGRGRTLEYRMIAADGKTVWVNDLPAVVSEGDQQVKILGVMTDVTNRKRMEEEHRTLRMQILHQQDHSQRLELELEKVQESLVTQAQAGALGQLAGRMVHELPHALGGVRNALNMVKPRLPTTDYEVAECIEMAEEEIRRTDRVIKNFLSDACGEELRIEDVDLSRLLADVNQQVRLPNEIRFYWSLNPEPFFIQADATQLGLVFTNLIQNAAQAMHRSGEILLTAKQMRDDVVITIYDTGPRVPPQEKGHVFEPLFTTKAEGVGLGLTISRRIVERHGGVIEYVADRVDGAAFCLRLPRRAIQEPQHLGDNDKDLVLDSVSSEGQPWKVVV